MGGYYARHDKLGNEIAIAIEDHYRPRFAGDGLPRNELGLVVALADKLETLAGLFAIGQLPTGDKDLFALRRHALGIVRMLMEQDLPLALALVTESLGLFPQAQPGTAEQLTDFIYERLAGLLREQGYSAQEVEAVLALRPQRRGRAQATGRRARLRRAARGAGAGRGQQAHRQHPEEGREGRSPRQRAAAEGRRREGALRRHAEDRAAGARAVRVRRLHRFVADLAALRGRSMPSSTTSWSTPSRRTCA